MKYRADIAGLRAVAVLPILLFHAGLNELPGGFVGVDVFFVISGFLITSLIVRDLEAGEFSILEFYRRRVARIVPALLVVLLAVIAAGYVFILLPSELQNLSDSVAMTSVFLSNFYFYGATDYFGTTAETTPLLHTWSLGVEEQFYILYPALLLVISRWGWRAVRHAIVVACMLSFIAALLLGGSRPAAAFYLLPSRAWELGVGAMIALRIFPETRSAIGAQVLAAIGLFAIVLAILFVEPSRWFPAPLAILPTVGAGLVIAYGRAGWTYRLLSLRPVTWLGGLSYSLYLWHWPVIAFYRLETGVSLSIGETAGLVFVSILLAWATHVLVEKPCLAKFRQGNGFSARTVALGGIGSLFSMAVIANGAAAAVRAAPGTYNQQAFLVASFVNYRDTPAFRYQFRKGQCLMGEEDPQNVNFDCLKIDGTKSNLVLAGDSHAAQYWRAISERFSSRNVIQATASGCRPLIGSTGEKRCTDLMKYVFANLAHNADVDTIILGGRWQENELDSLVATVSALVSDGLEVLVIGPGIEYDGDFPLLLAEAIQSGNEFSVEEYRLSARDDLDKKMEARMSDTGAQYLSVRQIMCGGGQCIHRDKEGEPLLFDYGHLTLDASRQIVSKMPLPLDSKVLD